MTGSGTYNCYLSGGKAPIKQSHNLPPFFLSCRPVGMPKMEKVFLHNPSSEEISLISISATTAHFHASFFQNRVSIACILHPSLICPTQARGINTYLLFSRHEHVCAIKYFRVKKFRNLTAYMIGLLTGDTALRPGPSLM